jgi:hypothetical protein
MNLNHGHRDGPVMAQLHGPGTGVTVTVVVTVTAQYTIVIEFSIQVRQDHHDDKINQP